MLLPNGGRRRFQDSQLLKEMVVPFIGVPHHKVPTRGFPNGLYVCSHKPENHEAWAAKNHRHKNTPTKEGSSAAGSKLVMTDKLRRVLTTTQPTLSSAQIDDFISEVLKE